MATLTRKRRKLIPRQRPADPTPTPAAVEPTRPQRIELPDDDATVTAACGCVGLVERTSRTHGGYVRVYVLDPCDGGPHERWSARCRVTFPASQVRTVVVVRQEPDVQPEPEPEPEPEPVQFADDDQPQPALFTTLTGRTAL